MFNRKAKQAKAAKPKTQKFDTGRKSPRNKTNAQVEGNRQQSLFKAGATGS